ncbi:MAG: PQQ-binding-like beta-propeller repeat protein [Actinobacteria bacterium]|nr:PQQ-binding-like beta-propeller repeat protein [Actinomycetota bacterium]
MRLPPLVPADSRPFDVVALGLNSLDILAVIPTHPVPGGKTRIETLATLPGGQSASAAVGCARLGWRTQYIGVYGEDDAARVGVESLTQEGVDTSRVRRTPGATSHTSIVLVDARSGDRTVIWHRDARLAMSVEDVPVDAVAGGRVFVPSVFSGLSALSARTGALLWRIPSGAYTYASPAYHRGRVYFGTYAGIVYCVDARSGRIIWTRSVGSAVSGAIVIVAGTVYAASFDHWINAWHWRSGRHLWRINRGEYVPISGNGAKLLIHGRSSLTAVVPRRKR